MSELYLVLRSRLEAVPDWVYIETEVLRAARDRKGYSYETAARELHVVSKTYERYEKAGRIPRPLIGAVAELFDLEIEEPTRQRVTVHGQRPSGSTDERLEAIEQLLASLDRKWDEADVAGRLGHIERALADRANLEI